MGDAAPADDGNLPGFLHIALRYDLALSPPQQRSQILARAAGITTRGEARQYLEEVAQRAAVAKPPDGGPGSP
jgi:phospholipase C